MRALTLCQPYATSIVGFWRRPDIGGWDLQRVDGPKRVENRTWRWPRTLRLPQVVAIHAGAQDWPDDSVRCLWPECPPPDELPRSAVVGIARVVACLPFDEVAGRCPAPPSRWADLVEASAWSTGPWCWVVDWAEALLEPVQGVRGFQGLWGLERYPEALAACTELATRCARDWSRRD